MNNKDFRELVGNPQGSPKENAHSASSRPQGAALGSRLKSSVPMTPRNLGGNNKSFARQLAEKRSQEETSKKFRSMAVPRGVKLAAGYQDRASTRAEAEQDERAARIQALEEQVKLGQISQSDFERIRDEITAGDVGATHLVKGLDKKLLERVRRGEDVFGSKPEQEQEQENGQKDSKSPEPLNEDDEFERLERKEVVPVERHHVEKKGELAPVAGVKRSRNDILAELKAQRQAAAEARAAAAQSQAGSRFKKFGEKQKPSFTIERDDKGNEVLLTVDENGRTKRKVRKVPVSNNQKPALAMPDPKAKPLGADVDLPLPAPPAPVEEEIDDIFEGVGDSYDPLGAVEDESDGDSSDSEDEKHQAPKQDQSDLEAAPEAEVESDTQHPPSVKRNYFNDTPASTETKPHENVPFQDPQILAALRRAAALDRNSDAADREGKEKSNGKKASTAAERLLGPQRDRDLDDMDMGFGGSRGGDEEDDEAGGRIKLSQWKGAGANNNDDDDEQQGRGGQARKRGKKKRKGDKNSAADIMRVIEGRK